MTNDELLAIIEGEESNCISASSGTLSEQRRKGLAYYNGEPYGNEQEGRSQVVTTEVRDAVEGILPSLMAIFTTSDEIVRFDPQNQDDEAKAQQATDYANYVFTRLNNGFLALYCLFKDTLLQKNGFVKVYWEKYTDYEKESYEGLDEFQFRSLLSEPDLELTAHTENPLQDPMLQQLAMQAGLPPVSHDAEFRRSKKYGKVCIDPLPPEEVDISRDTPNDLSKARFVQHKTKKTLSQIRAMGYEVSDDIADDSSDDLNPERVERNKPDDDGAWLRSYESADKTTKTVWLKEAYFHVDFDGDGHAEYRKVTRIGKTVLDNVEFDALPIIGGSASPVPHKFYGQSIYDLVGDIQLIKSTITRQLLDNAYVANNGRLVVLDGMANMDDLLQSRPNGIVRTKAMGAVTRLDNPLLGAPFYNLLEYFDQVKQQRVGATGFPNAVNPDAINAKATFVDTFRDAAMERVNLMARILAEGPVKQIFSKIIELESKFQDKPRTIKLRGNWTEVDPREWKNKFDMTVSVGLGSGSQQTIINGAQMVYAAQVQAAQLGLAGRVVTEENFYQSIRQLAKAVFPRNYDAFATDPKLLPPPEPPPPDPNMMKAQTAQQKMEIAAQQKEQKMQIDTVLEQQRQEWEQKKAAFEALQERAAQQREHDLEVMRIRAEADKESRQAMIDALTQVRIAQEQGQQEKSSIVLKGVVDKLLADQEHHHAKVEEMVKGAVQAKVAKAAPKPKQPSA